MKKDQYLINMITASRIVKKPENLKHHIVNTNARKHRN